MYARSRSSESDGIARCDRSAHSIGYVRDLINEKGIDVGLGAMVTINTNPSTLTPYYGCTTPGGWEVFLRFRPSKMKYELQLNFRELRGMPPAKA